MLHMSVITQNGESALMVGARWGNTEGVVELVEAGANVNMQTEVCQYNMYIHVDIVTILQCNVSCIYMCP